MNEVVSLKSKVDGVEVEYEVLSPLDLTKYTDERQIQIIENINSVDILLNENQKQIDEINAQIDTLTNHADGIDYAVSVACGVLTGAIDVLLVGEFDFTTTKENVDEKFKEFVSKKAKKVEEEERNEKIKKAIADKRKKAEEKGETLSNEEIQKIKDGINKKFDESHDINQKIQKAIEKAKERGEVIDDKKIKEITDQINNNEMAKSIRKLEQKFGIPSDSAYEEIGNGISSMSHHLDDLAHHPTPVGWMASIMTQFTGNAYFQNKDGTNIKIKAKPVKVIKNGKEKVEIRLIGEGIKEKLFCGTVNWLGHLVSDMAGSNSSVKKGNLGMGLPGPILSTLKELSMLPIIKKTPLPKLLYDLFTNDSALLSGFKMDLRSELALGIELGKQAIPVFINEVLVRAFYFIRRFIAEAKKAENFKDINWGNTFPFKNRTIVRMLTISYGTFETIDLADAAIRGAIKSGGTLPGFFANFVLRVNFVGVGRFAIACGTDVSMGVKNESLRRERIRLYNEQIYMLEAKVYYRQGSMWIAAENASIATDELCLYINEMIPWVMELNERIISGVRELEQCATKIAANNPEWAEQMKRKLRR